MKPLTRARDGSHYRPVRPQGLGRVSSKTESPISVPSELDTSSARSATTTAARRVSRSWYRVSTLSATPRGEMADASHGDDRQRAGDPQSLGSAIRT